MDDPARIVLIIRCFDYPQCGAGRHDGVVRVVVLLVGCVGLGVVGSRVWVGVVGREDGAPPVVDALVVRVGGVVAVVGPPAGAVVGSSAVTVACTGGRPLTTSPGVPCSRWAPRLNARAAAMVPTMTAPPSAASGGRGGAPIRRVSVTGRRTARHAATSLRVSGAPQPGRPRRGWRPVRTTRLRTSAPAAPSCTAPARSTAADRTVRGRPGAGHPGPAAERVVRAGYPSRVPLDDRGRHPAPINSLYQLRT
jgi:hypothetical protein